MHLYLIIFSLTYIILFYSLRFYTFFGNNFLFTKCFIIPMGRM